MDDHRKNFVLSLLAYAVQKDVSPERLCTLAGLDFKALQKNTVSTISAQQFDSLWRQAADLTRDPLFGLHFGESLRLSALGIVGQIIQTSRTTGEALRHAAGFIGLITDLFTMEVSEGRKTFSISFIPKPSSIDSPSAFRHMMDLALVFVIHEVDGLILKKISPVSVKIPFTPADESEYARVLRCTPSRKNGEYRLEFDIAYLHEPILTAHYELQQLFLEKAATLSRQQQTTSTLKEKISAFLMANAYLGIPTLEELAANFNTSARSLQRKLQEEGVTYQQLADEIRKSLALHYLQAGHHRVKEISYMLGYNELSAFTRAFKRWTGKSPVNFQQASSRK